MPIRPPGAIRGGFYFACNSPEETTMPRKDNWKPERLDSNESPKGRDISSAVDKAAKSRTATSLGGKKC
jgi:hypothetical protein